jgi:hypothetical protein
MVVVPQSGTKNLATDLPIADWAQQQHCYCIDGLGRSLLTELLQKNVLIVKAVDYF